MCIKFVTPSGPHTTCCLREQAVRVFRIPVTSSLSNCSHVTLFGQQHSKECFFFHVEAPSASFYHCHGELSSSPFFSNSCCGVACILWCMVPMFSTTASCRGLGRAAASGAREVGTLPIAMHLQEPGEVDCQNQKVLSSKGKCVLHYKLQNYNGKFGIFST